MPQRIKVMHDYECWPLWREAEGEASRNLDPHELRLTPGLVGRLQAWQAWGDSRLNLADPADSRPLAESEDEAFDEEGRLLARRVAGELPDCAVIYWRDAG